MYLMKPMVLVFAFSFVILNVSAQKGRITGKILDSKTGTALANATVKLEPGNKSLTADLNGVFAFSNLPAGTYSITANYVSYSSKTDVDIVLKNGETVIHDVVLDPVSATLANVTVKGRKINKESASALLALQKNRSSISDGISAEVIRRTPDKSAGDVIKRVSGASLQDDKFAVIRGLNDRYNNSLLNGATLPSSESDRKAFAFDIFPANLLDNIIIAKTATPDLPGEFAGGIIMVNTKSIPDQNFQSISIGTGYNSLTTFKNSIGYKGGTWNYLKDGKDFPGVVPPFKYFPTRFADQEALAKKFINNWGLTKSTFGPNLSLQYTLGRNFQDEQGRDFAGMLLSVTYNKTNSLFDINRKLFENDGTDPNLPSIKTADFTNTIYSTKILAGVLGNFSFKINNNNIFNFKNIFNISSDDRLIQRFGERDINPIDNTSVMIKQNARVFNGNKFYSSQLEGQHYIPTIKLKMIWSGFYTNVTRTNPSRNDTYILDINDNTYKAQIGDGANDNDAGTMKTNFTQETIKGGQFDVLKNINLGKSVTTELKAGFSYQMRNREFDSRRLGFAQGRTFNYSIINQGIDSLFDIANMGKGGFRVVDKSAPFDTYNGNTKTLAYYAMLDQRFFKIFRLIYGGRFENFVMKLNSIKSDFVTPLNYDNKVNTFLPSANVVLAISDKQNVRLCYSQTVNRPEFREIAPFLFYDYSTGFTVSGNDTLKAARIYNYDLRYEIYPGRGQVFSITGFYKKFKTPIETVYQLNAVNPNISYQNSPDATNIGAEAEIRILFGSLLKSKGAFLNNLTLMANYAYIKSKVIIPYSDEIKVERSLQGQSPYVINGGLLYNDEKHGFGLSAFVNRTGARIFYGGNNYFPDVWENGRTVVDFQITKSFIKQRLEIRANAKDLFAQRQYFFEDENNNKKLDMDSDNLVQTTTFGRVLSINIAYKF